MSMTFFESSSKMEQKKSTLKRNQLLNAALDVFSVYGFSGASLDEIAQLANMHKSNIFYYYENKESLYVEVLTTVLQKWLAPLQTLEVANKAFADETAQYRAIGKSINLQPQ